MSFETQSSNGIRFEAVWDYSEYGQDFWLIREYKKNRERGPPGVSFILRGYDLCQLLGIKWPANKKKDYRFYFNIEGVRGCLSKQ